MDTYVHDDSPDPVQRDRTESASDASQHVTDESVVPDFFSDSSANTSISSFSSPLLQHQRRNQSFLTSSHSSPASNMASMNGSVSSQLESSIPIHQTFDAAQPQPPPIPQQIVLTALPNSRYGCPRCPRTFSNLKKAEYVTQPT